MLVGLADFDAAVEHLIRQPTLALDTETTGLRPYHGDRLFSIIFYDGITPYYFNFQDYPDEGVKGLPRTYIQKLKPLLEQETCVVKDISEQEREIVITDRYLHNAKYDMHILKQEDISVGGQIWCTQSMARVLYNDHIRYSLAACAKRIGLEKDDAVEEYVKKHKLWEWVTIPGKKRRDKIKYYDKVPLSIMHPYGEQDVIVDWQLGVYQREELVKIHFSSPKNHPTVWDIGKLEMDCTEVFFDMEHHGVRIDSDYCYRGAGHEAARVKRTEESLLKLNGLEFIDSNKHLSQIFANLNIKYPTTEKGNPSFPDEFLETLTNPVAQLVQTHRNATKRGGTYFQGFLYWADNNNYLHPDMRQGGPKTGRISYANPNLQNLTKKAKDNGEYKVRRCILPDNNKSTLFSIDYDQMELKLMLDYAGQMDMIRKIRYEGYDGHDATAELAGISRSVAKTLNFGLLYGMGIDLLASKSKLNCTIQEAKAFKYQYFSKLGLVRTFIRRSSSRAERRGYVYDWHGRRFYFSDPRFAYKAANAIIQGGCASIVKKVMVEIHDYLKDKKSRMLIQIHDEILFNIVHGEEWIIPHLKKIMEDAYPYKNIPMTCSVTYSHHNFYDMQEYSAT